MNTLAVILTLLIFSFHDYVLYNPTSSDTSGYRVHQLAFQTILTGILYTVFTETEAIAFNLAWWSGVTDELFYGWSYLINRNNENNLWWEPHRNQWQILRQHGSQARSWTPIGLIQGANKHKHIAGNTLLAQAVTGFTLSLLLTLTSQ